MIEMRREKRWPAKLNLEISNLFKQDHVKVENINAPIEVIDVPKRALVFVQPVYCRWGITLMRDLLWQKTIRSIVLFELSVSRKAEMTIFMDVKL